MLKTVCANRSASFLLSLFLLDAVWAAGCARLPYTVKVVHADQRVAVTLQQEVAPAGYTHPVHLTTEAVTAILRGFSLREQQRLPLRWFAEETPPKKVFREDELLVLAPHLASALQSAGPEQRIRFELFGPGMNPRYQQDVTVGWIAVSGRLFQLTVDYFHVQQPVRKSDLYDYNYPTPWSGERTYLLFFEPGRFYLTDPKAGTRGVDFSEFLKYAPLP